jgi:hypothetical protein
MAVIDELMAEDILWHFPGNSQVSGDFKGKPEVMSWLGKQAELSASVAAFAAWVNARRASHRGDVR